MNRLIGLLWALMMIGAAPAAAQSNPAAARNALLAADRNFSQQAAARDPAEGIAAAFAPDVVVSMRQGAVSGREQAILSLRANPNYQGSHARWRPIGGLVSADGQQGVTTGYLDIDGFADAQRAGRRYLAYWVKRPEGWRILAYRQVIRQPDEPIVPSYSPPLPSRALRATPRAAAAHATEVAAAERAFSDRAQQVGLKAAFGEFGHPQAIHLAAPRGYAIGLQAITANFEEGSTSPLRWSSDRTVAASSGDLGLSIGRIYPNGAAPAGQPASIPFFTIWHRDPGGQWRYIAE